MLKNQFHKKKTRKIKSKTTMVNLINLLLEIKIIITKKKYKKQ